LPNPEPGPNPVPSYAQDVIYAGAPPPKVRTDAIAPGPPIGAAPSALRSEAIAAGAPGAAISSKPQSSPKTDVGSLRSDFNVFVCWLAGVFLIIVCGWGLIGFCCYLPAWLHLRIPYLLAGTVGALISLGLLSLLEKDMWLSRFMGLRLGTHSTQWTETLLVFFTGIVGLLLRSSDRPAPASAKSSQENDGVREIVETVVFVVVLVLLLKTFLVEAFVIPTGSMADTLLGYHRDFTCEKCGFKFIVNASSQAEPQNGQQPERIIGGECPNCGYPHVDMRR
jgi:hypothetical protein